MPIDSPLYLFFLKLQFINKIRIEIQLIDCQLLKRERIVFQEYFICWVDFLRVADESFFRIQYTSQISFPEFLFSLYYP